MKIIFKAFFTFIVSCAFLSNVWGQTVIVEEEPAAEAGQSAGIVPQGITGEEEVEIAKEAAPAPSPKIGVTPSLSLRPIGTDRDLGNQGVWFEIKPGASLSADLPTGTGKMLKLSAGYEFLYRQYLDNNKEIKFEHDISLGLNHAFSKKFSISIPVNFYIFQYYRLGNQNSNEFDLETWPAFQYALYDNLKLKMGVYAFMLYTPNNKLYWDQIGSIGNPPTDPGELIRGAGDLSSLLGSSGYSSYWASFGLLPPEDIEGEVFKFAMLGPYAEVSYSFPSSTTLMVRYRYYAHTWTNSDGHKFRGHEAYFTLSQDVWQGGSLSLTWRPRYRKFPFAFSELGNQKVDWRHRFVFTFNQQINEYIGIDTFYRLDYVTANTANPSKAHDFYVGVNFSF